MAFTSPVIIPLSKVGFNSKTRTVSNLAVPNIEIDVSNDTAQVPMQNMVAPRAGGQQQPFSFSTMFNPSGSAAGAKTPPDDLLFWACGLQQTIATTVSTTYAWTGDLANTGSPVTVTPVALAVAVGNALQFHAANSVGNLVMRAVAGQPLMCDWAFKGTYSIPTDAAIADTLANGGAAPICLGAASTTMNAKTLVIRSWTLNLNNTIEDRPDVAQATGYAVPKITHQNPTLELVIELPVLATDVYWTAMFAAGNTLHAFSSALGTGAGYVITITGKFYLAGIATIALGNILGLRLSYQMDTVTGSPLSIVLT